MGRFGSGKVDRREGELSLPRELDLRRHTRRLMRDCGYE